MRDEGGKRKIFLSQRLGSALHPDLPPPLFPRPPCILHPLSRILSLSLITLLSSFNGDADDGGAGGSQHFIGGRAEE